MNIRTTPLVLSAAALLVVGGGVTAAYADHSTDDVNCGDFSSLEELQVYVDQHPGDPDDLDGNEDGVACESDFPPGATLGGSEPEPEETTEEPEPEPEPEETTEEAEADGDEEEMAPVAEPMEEEAHYTG